MGVFDKVKAKAEQLFGRAEQLYGESHGDTAATLDGEAHVVEGEIDEETAERHHHRSDGDDVSGAR